MKVGVSGIIDRFAGLRVAVIGDAMLDGYIDGEATRLSPEAPVPVVDVRERVETPGGAANVAINLAALGARVCLIAVVGDDAPGARLMTLLDTAGVDCAGIVRDPERTTLHKLRIAAAGHAVVRIDEGSTGPVCPATRMRLVAAIERAAPVVDAIIVSDYGYGVVGPEVISALAMAQDRTPLLLAVDTKDYSPYGALDVALAKPNYGQALALLDGEQALEGTRRLHQVAASSERLLALTGARIAAVTLDADGALILERDAPPYRTYARARAASPAGAGDTFLAAMTLALAAGAATPVAAEIAAAAASVVVAHDRTAACPVDELRTFFESHGKIIAGRDEAARLMERERGQGRRIVFTNGCFDLLHRGHITYLNRAKALGDLLVVGVNDDASVRRLKGAERPLNPLEDRMQVLAAMSAVDYVVPFSEDTPVELVRAVRPSIFVKGGDYTIKELPEAAIVEEGGGQVQILPYLEGRSTTSLIERIRSERQAPRQEVAR